MFNSNFHPLFVLLITTTINLVVDVKGQDDFRLPTSLHPTHYALQIQPILDETPGHTRFSAPGHVTITVNCTEDTSTIKLHALDMVIIEEDTQVTNLEGGGALIISSLEYEPIHHFFVIRLGETLKAGGKYDIFIRFIAPVSQTRLDGMYLDEYVDPRTNETRYVATTTFAAISARRCFPSFDEPQMKAVFTISLARKEGYHSLSNRHQVSSAPLPGMEGWYLDSFAPSPPMSTYLVAMIVSDMTYEEAIITKKNSADDTTIRVYAPYYFIDRGGGFYAANQTKTVLAQFETYFDSIFPLQKLDSVSLPRFFYSAMENWALITYNDRVLLYFPGETTEPERYRITSIIAHEVVHHYFGNLVTCRWWTWIYLNEGSATYWSHLGVELTYPEFAPWDRFISDTYQLAMEYDLSEDTHPVANPPKNTADIGGIYDTIAYQKGACLLRMMSGFLTRRVVQMGTREYLKEHEYSNVDQSQLFQKLDESADKLNVTLPAPLNSIMDGWTELSGYPLITVARIDSLQVKFSQKRYEANETGSDDLWWIPVSISVIAPDPKELFFWMPNGENETIFEIPENGIFVVNPRSEGYFRTLYSSHIYSGLAGVRCGMSGSAKAKLIDDYLTFSRHGKVELEPLQIFETFICPTGQDGESLLVWQTIFKYFTTELLNLGMSNPDSAKLLLSEMADKLLPQIITTFDKLKEEEKGEQGMLKGELLFWACFLDKTLNICEAQAEEKMDVWMLSAKEDSNRMSPFPVNLEETYFCLAAQLNQKYGWEIFRILEEEAKSPARKTRLLSALTCSGDQDLLQKVIPQLKESFALIGKGSNKMIITQKMITQVEWQPFVRGKLRMMLNEPAKNLMEL